MSGNGFAGHGPERSSVLPYMCAVTFRNIAGGKNQCGEILH